MRGVTLADTLRVLKYAIEENKRLHTAETAARVHAAQLAVEAARKYA